MTKHGKWRIWVGFLAYGLFEYYYHPSIGWRVFAGLIVAIFCRRLLLDEFENMLFEPFEPWLRKMFNDPRHAYHGCYRSLVISEMFTGKTAGGFKVGYEVEVISDRIIHLYFKRAGLTSNVAQRALVRDFNRDVILPLFAERQYCFGLELQREEIDASRSKYHFTLFGKPASLISSGMEGSFRAPIIRRIEVNGKIETMEIADATLREEVTKKEPFRKHGCNVRLHALRHDYMSDELVEENYAMLDENDKQQMESDERFKLAEEKLVVGILKRRLEFLGRQSNQRHDADMFSIETEKVGRSVRIRWKFKSDLPEGYELVGFKKTGGFFANQFDMQQNGPMVAQSRRDDEAMERLEEGEANFYTFFVRALHAREDGSVLVYSPLRFRLLVSTKDENEEIESLLRRIEQTNAPDPARQNISKLLRDFGLVFEFHNAVDAMEKALIADIKNKNLPKKEQDEKIAFVRDTIRLQRERYEP